LLASGRYKNASEVLRDALRLKRQLAALDDPIEHGIADEAGPHLSGPTKHLMNQVGAGSPSPTDRLYEVCHYASGPSRTS
jgi:putative addiction module CopG family antidote